MQAGAPSTTIAAIIGPTMCATGCIRYPPYGTGQRRLLMRAESAQN